MATEQGRSLPKFGEWDVNNPASAEGFTVIFSKARDERNSMNGGGNRQNSQRNDNPQRQAGDNSHNSIPNKCEARVFPTSDDDGKQLGNKIRTPSERLLNPADLVLFLNRVDSTETSGVVFGHVYGPPFRTIELILLESLVLSWELQIDCFYMDLSFEDIFSEPAAKLGPATGKFQPKGRFGPKRGPLAAGTSNVPPSKENKLSYLQATTLLTEVNPVEPVIPPIDGSGNHECSLSENVVGSSGIDNSSAAQNHIFHAEDVFSTLAVSADGDAQIDKDRSETEGEPVFATTDSSGNLHDRDAASSQEKGKIPNEIQSQGEDPVCSLFSSAANLRQEPHPLDVTVETEYPNAGSFLSDTHDDIFDYSAISFDDAGDLVSHMPNVDMSGNISDPREPVTMDAMPRVMATSAPVDQNCDGLAWSEENTEQQENISTTMANHPLGEELNEVNNDHANHLNTSDNCDNEASRNSSFARKRAPRNMKKPQEKKQKVDAQEKGVSDVAQEHSPKKPCKNFSHSTRRGRRRVDEKLLQIPEDEIDYRQLRMRDLIMLAGHRERLANKMTIPAKPSPNNQSADKTSHGGDASASANGKESFISEQGGDPSDQVDNEESTVPLFNYHSFMEKTPRTRWSKLDTELFYAGIRQFGTDLAMIKELFPNLTRQQVKLKYKKEERQNPQRLSEALASRAKDHSHFQLVIERLQATAQAAKESSMGFAVSASGDEEAIDSAIETNGEVENPRTEAPDEDPARDAGIHENSLEPDQNNSESEDDIFDKLDTYKSEF
ncbi:hypothetical protein MLD38_013239 [Melastoma candidum]|uniref:Uncharacterized protein n=1 Tax=Melastoma candidum TaxID=119954 RepID=A0ACB9RAS1_9MYRT|nr:hypothetical protein MLD38_013239 [Melastoma candidum]